MPAALASAVHRTISLRMNAPNSSGDIGETITPTLASFSRVAGMMRNFLLSAKSLLTMGAGVPAGASNPY